MSIEAVIDKMKGVIKPRSLDNCLSCDENLKNWLGGSNKVTCANCQQNFCLKCCATKSYVPGFRDVK